MKSFFSNAINFIVILTISACNMQAAVPATDTPVSVTMTAVTSTENLAAPSLSITLGETNDSQGITLDHGGDVDTQALSIGTPAAAATDRRSLFLTAILSLTHISSLMWMTKYFSATSPRRMCRCIILHLIVPDI